MKKNKLPIHCSYSDLINPTKLKPNPKNINKHPEEQVQVIARIINAHGWRLPITVSKKTGYIVRGEGRLKAALELELDEVPVDYQDYKNEQEELADLAADSKATEGSYLDEDLEKSLLKELSENEFDLSLAGYSYERVKELLGLDEDKDSEDEDDEENKNNSSSKWEDELESENKYLVIIGNDFRTLIDKELFNKFKSELERCSGSFDYSLEDLFKMVIKQGIVSLRKNQ